MVFFDEKSLLTSDVISSWTSKCGDLYKQYSGKKAVNDSDFKMKILIPIEGLLKLYKETYGTDTECHIVGKKVFGNIRFEISQVGAEKDPLYLISESEYIYESLSKLSEFPVYTYDKKTSLNKIVLNTPKKKGTNRTLLYVVGALLAAILIYIILSNFAPTSVDYIYKSVTEPIFKKMVSIIAALATPLILFSVIVGIMGLGDVGSFGKIGGKVLSAMGITYLFTAVIQIVVYTIANNIIPMPTYATAKISDDTLKNIIQLVLDVIPSNLVDPFLKDNDLQVIVIAIFVGVVLLVLGKQISKLKEIINDISVLVNKMMIYACKLLPLIVLFGIFNLLVTTDLTKILPLLLLFVYFIIFVILIYIFVLIRVRVTTKVPFGIIFKKLLPTLVINLLTSSSITSLSENLRCCKYDLGIDEKYSNFAMPLGIVIYMPCGAAFLSATALFLAAAGGVTITTAVIIRVVIVGIIVAIAAPPIPGSALAVMPIMFASCGVPDSMFSIAIIVSTILGYLLPALNVFLLQNEVIIVAVKTGNIDTEKLKTPKNQLTQ